ncbi:MAG: hotdog fold thioesterase [Bacteroidota bacterium]|nr:hotdog fold thioesterase [Bacteroidota bacterium]
MFNKSLTIVSLNEIGIGTMVQHLEIEFIEIGENFLKAKMPVINKTRQPQGLLHGGASVALAETLGSVAAYGCIDTTKKFCVGLEINANHIKGVKEGFVTGIASPIHLGKKTHVWEIKIRNEKEELICISRITMAILDLKN